ncbi:hypothetical protein AOQ84DRAFT_420323 [Glonium stellatum]|uniref:Uncharacterized protein n=1 Tax=Glonium stellatum TaxID=574774 RepID=A0A8E2F8K2_9PEZI|nr:hypothetical protein AOQ84DRAFT_420323 [Glonium stellatum]
MASRIQAPSLNEDFMNDSYPESSPDPLSISHIGSRPRGVRATSKQYRKAPMAPSSANTQQPQQQSNFDMPTVDFPSPTKSMTMRTGGTGGISPWRIKVTVEAEPEFDGSDEENVGYGSPRLNHTMRTTATTIPLRDPDASSPVKRRGRPRKSDASSTAKSKRSGTPVRRKSKPRNSNTGVTQTSFSNTVVDNASTSTKKRRGRPRKSLQSEADIVPPDNRGNTSSENTTQEAQFGTVNSSYGNRSLEGDASWRVEPNYSSLKSLHEKYSAEDQIEKPEIRCWDQRIKRRVPTPAKTPRLPEGSTQPQQRQGEIGHEQDEESILESQRACGQTKAFDDHRSTLIGINGNASQCSKTPSSPMNDKLHTPSESDSRDDADMWRAMVAREHADDEQALGLEDNRSKGQDESSIEDANGHYELEEVNTISCGDQDTTILESEGFSMVSIDSLPSRQACLSSPPYRNAGINTLRQSIGPGIDQESLNLPNKASEQDHYDLPSGLSTSFMPSSTGLTPSNTRSSPPLAPPKQHTPSLMTKSPSAPPPISVQQFSPQKASTPKLARVVKAGIALQGVLDPVTEASSEGPANESLERKIDRLDDLFSGFSEGTRRELRAGLRLGEQIAKQYQQRSISKEASPLLSRPSTEPDTKAAEDDIFTVLLKVQQNDASYQRLPTPEDDHYILAIPSQSSERTDVEYPSLSVPIQSTQLASPARSVDEMSWQADTPKSTGHTTPELAVGSLRHIRNAITVQQDSVISPGKYADEFSTYIQWERKAADQQPEKSYSSQVVTTKDDEPEKQDNHSDIWHEEASRSLEALPCDEVATDIYARHSLSLQDLFTDDASQLKPARGKIPKTWRRKSSSDFNYSDEPEPETEEGLSSNSAEQKRTEATESKTMFQKSKTVERRTDEVYESDDSDDTGMFWQQNLPNVYRKSNSSRPKGTKLDLSMLLGIDDSPLKNSLLNSPRKLSPSKNSPNKIAPLQLSPHKSNVVKRLAIPNNHENLQHIDQSSQAYILEQTSPSCDGTDDSVSSDIRQLRAEMEARPFEHHNLTLHEIEEVTEHSEQQDMATASPLSPPKPPETSILAPKRAYSPIFSDTRQKAASISARKSTEHVTIAEVTRTQSPGLFNRLTSTLWSAVTPTVPPPSHPIISRYDPLPRLEPWTKTHYKTLDAMFQYHKRHPTAFTPSSPPNLNNALLNAFSDRAKFLGAKYSCWGYSVAIDETHIVIAAAFMQLLTLQDIAEYERVTRKTVQRGSVGPGPDGKVIGAETVVRRLFTIVAGEELRKDEKKGKDVSKNGGLKIQWPNEENWMKW